MCAAHADVELVGEVSTMDLPGKESQQKEGRKANRRKSKQKVSWYEFVGSKKLAPAEAAPGETTYGLAESSLPWTRDKIRIGINIGCGRLGENLLGVILQRNDVFQVVALNDVWATSNNLVSFKMMFADYLVMRTL